MLFLGKTQKDPEIWNFERFSIFARSDWSQPVVENVQKLCLWRNICKNQVHWLVTRSLPMWWLKCFKDDKSHWNLLYNLNIQKCTTALGSANIWSKNYHVMHDDEAPPSQPPLSVSTQINRIIEVNWSRLSNMERVGEEEKATVTVLHFFKSTAFDKSKKR